MRTGLSVANALTGGTIVVQTSKDPVTLHAIYVECIV